MAFGKHNDIEFKEILAKDKKKFENSLIRLEPFFYKDKTKRKEQMKKLDQIFKEMWVKGFKKETDVVPVTEVAKLFYMKNRKHQYQSLIIYLQIALDIAWIMGESAYFLQNT